MPRCSGTTVPSPLTAVLCIPRLPSLGRRPQESVLKRQPNLSPPLVSVPLPTALSLVGNRRRQGEDLSTSKLWSRLAWSLCPSNFSDPGASATSQASLPAPWAEDCTLRHQVALEMVVIEIRVHTLDGKPLGSNPEVPAGRKGDAISTRAFGLESQESSGESVSPGALCPDLTPTDPMCLAFCHLCFYLHFLCLRLGAPWERLSLSDCPPYRALHPDSLQNVKEVSPAE